MFALSPVCRMASIAVISPARQRATTRSKLSGMGSGLRPVYLPCPLAMAIPSRWRWRIYSRSNSATAANTVSINFPVGVVVSMASLRLTNSTCFSVSRSTRSSRSRVFRANRLIDSTITVSPRRTYSIMRVSSGRSAFFAACLFDEYFVNTELAQQNFLPRSILLLGADTDIADFQIFHSIHCNRVILHSDIFQKP